MLKPHFEFQVSNKLKKDRNPLAKIKTDEEELIIKVSWLYYFANLTQLEIANKLNLSRPKVGRLLNKALENGIIQIQFSPEIKSFHIEIENELETRFGLTEAIVVESGANKAELLDNLGRAAAGYLDRSLKGDFLLGLGMGSSLSTIPNYMNQRKANQGTIITLSGGFSQQGNDTSDINSSWPLAQKLNARLEILYCPLYVENEETRNVLLNDDNIKSQITKATECDYAVISIGLIGTEMGLYQRGYIDHQEVEDLITAGAVGEILISFYDLDGNEVKTGLDKRNIGLGIDELSKIPVTIGVSGGLPKTRAILGALRNGLLNVLVTDLDTAQAIIKLDDKLKSNN